MAGAALVVCVVIAAMVSIIAAATGDTTADLVLGQENFSQGASNLVDAQGMSYPGGAVVDSAGHLFVADPGNSRILGWKSVTALASGESADLVIGQPDGLSSLCDDGGSASASLLCGPRHLALDSAGDLYVADSGNNRVLVYGPPYANADCTSTPCIGAPAIAVFGQGGSFTSSIPNNGGIGQASLDNPSGVAVDASGNVYVADSGNNRVLEYNTPIGAGGTMNAGGDIAAVVFGQGSTGTNFASGMWNNGGASATSLYDPQGIAVDSAGNLWVADEYNSRVLEYNAPLNASSGETGAGDVTADNVLGQSGSFTSSSGNQGLSPSASTLDDPQGVSVDTAGDVFVADTSNSRVLEFTTPITATGILSAGGDLASAVFGQSGFTTNVCGNGASSLAPLDSTGLCSPASVAMDSVGNVYIADSGNNRVLEYNTPFNTNSGEPNAGDTTADTVLGQVDFTYGSANLVDARGMSFPADVAVDGSGHIYLADESNNRVLGWPDVTALTDGEPATVVIGQPNLNSYLCNQGGAASASTLCSPVGVAVDQAGNLYVADSSNNRVLEYNTPFNANSGEPNAGDGVADMVFGQNGSFTSSVSNQGANAPSATSLSYPAGVAVDSLGNLYVADPSNSRVLEYNAPVSSANETADMVFGQTDFTSAVFNIASATALYGPQGVAVDSLDNLYVADSNNNRVVEYNTPLNGSSGEPGAGDTTADNVLGQGGSMTSNGYGVGTDAMNYPESVAVDSAENVYVTDSYNNRVLEYNDPFSLGAPSSETGAGDLTADLVFGQTDFVSSACADSYGTDPLISATGLCYPFGVTLDSSGNLYIADSYNSRVLRYDQPLVPPSPTATATATATPTATPTPSAGAKMTVNPMFLNLGKIAVGQTSTAQFSITNNGSGEMVGNVASPGAPFSIVSGGGGFALAPGDVLTVTVEFAPHASGQFTDSLEVTGSDPQKPSDIVGLKGTAQ